MVNIVFFGGTGRFGEDCEFKYGIGKYLPDGWDVRIVSRVKEAKKYVEVEKKVKFEYIYDDEIFKRKLTSSEIEEAERWLRHPLRVLKHYSRNIKDIQGNKRLEERIFELTAKHIIFWRKYFKENKTDIFSTTLISDLPSTVPLLSAKRADVKVLNLVPGKFGISNILTNENYDLIEWNKKSYDEEECEEYYRKKNEEYKTKRDIPYKSWSNEVLQNLSLFNPSILWKKTRQFKEFVHYRKRNKIEDCYESTRFFISQYFNSITRKIITPRLLKPIEKNKKFFFFPMHYLIDAQILYREPFLDQYNLLKQISHCLPIDTNLYVKPHPHWLGSEINYHRAKQLIKIENIQFIPYTVNPYYLMNNAIATLTINSTVGYEAIIMNKPLITFGHESYANKGLALVVKDLKELPEIIFNIIRNPSYGIDVNKRKKFIYKFYRNTISLEGRYIYDYGWKYTENDYKNIADVYVKAWKNYRILR